MELFGLEGTLKIISFQRDTFHLKKKYFQNIAL